MYVHVHVTTGNSCNYERPPEDSRATPLGGMDYGTVMATEGGGKEDGGKGGKEEGRGGGKEDKTACSGRTPTPHSWS